MSKPEDPPPPPPPDSAALITTTPSTTAGSTASMSPQSISQSQAVKGTSTSTAELFPAGAEVEVKIGAEGFYDSWYEATVVSHRISLGPRGSVRYKVRYLEFLRDDGSGEKLVEHVSARDVRPRPPPRRTNGAGTGGSGGEDEDPEFNMYDLVEAYHNDGWWHGVISGLRNPETGLYTVSFPNSREVFHFKPAEIRPKLAFVNGNWVSVSSEEEKIEGNFKEGDDVEVHQLRDKTHSYFPAKINKVIHNSYYQVKYDSPFAQPNGDLTEILEPHYLRPAINAINGVPDEISCFAAGSHVEFFQNGCWSPGTVCRCVNGTDYEVKLGAKGKPMAVVNVCDLRVRLSWDGKNWSKWSSPSKEKKRTSAHSSKSFTSDVALSEKDEITPNNVVSKEKKKDETTPNYVVSKGKKRKSAHSSKIFTSDVEKDEITRNNVVSGGKKISSAHKSVTSDVALAENDEMTPNNVVSKEKKKDEITPNDMVSKGKKRKSAHSSKNVTSDVALAEKNDITPNNVVSKEKKKDEITRNNVVSKEKKKDEITPNNVVSEGKKRKSAHSIKSVTSDVALSEKDEITPNNNSVVSKGKKLRKESSEEKGEEFQNPLQHKATPSMDLEHEDEIPITQLIKARHKLISKKNNKSSKSPKILSAVRKVPHSRKLLTELKDCQSKISKGKRTCCNCKGNSNDCHINKKQDDMSHNRWITLENHQNNVIFSMESYSDVPQPDITNPLLPFKKTSPIWKTLETFQVFIRIPQSPHFSTLESKSKEDREGLAIGMMVTYANIIESLQNLSIESEPSVLEEKITCLISLKENGFIVDPILTHLHEMLAIKTEIINSDMKRSQLETELANNEKENNISQAAVNICDAKLEDVRKELEEYRRRVNELELKEKFVVKEKEEVLSLKGNRERVMLKLREEICSIESSHAVNLAKYERVRSTHFIY